MKKILGCLALVFIGLPGSSQSKQVKMYLEQIEANSVYLQYIKKAISIARTGLTTISDMRNGEFKLHDLFFKGLSTVNPKIRNWNKVADIISCQVHIVQSYKASFKQVKESGQFSPDEVKYMFKVFSKLLDDCRDLIIMLADVLTDGTYKMSDDERIKCIDVLYVSMQSNYKFCQKFSNNKAVLAMQRSKEQNETTASKKIFDIH